MSGKVSAATTERQYHAELLARFKAPMASVEERKAAGKALRAQVPHEQHAEYRPAPKRADPVAILQEQAKTRHPFLVPIRYARMLASPFAFLRGSATLMARDLAAVCNRVVAEAIWHCVGGVKAEADVDGQQDPYRVIRRRQES